MLVVTFGRAASQELRERVRAQLVEAERALADPGAAAPPSSPTCSSCCSTATPTSARCGTAAARATRWPASTPPRSPPPTSSASMVLGSPRRRRRHRRRAPRWSRTSTTCCARSSTTSTSARSPRPTTTPSFTRARGAGHRAATAVGDPQARLEPRRRGPATPRPAAGSRSPTRSAPRSSAASGGSGSCRYDDLLSQLADALEPPDAPARARMRQRWKVVLVDEFQDTDPVQWQVFDRAFSGHATMVLIGDPKQAIYAFRGGDVVTYLAAAEHRDHDADARRQLAQRRAAARLRSRPCSRGAALGDQRIVVHDVTRPPRRPPADRAPATRRSGCGWCAATARPARQQAAAVGQVRDHVVARPRRRRQARCSRPARTFDGRALEPARRRRDRLPARATSPPPATALHARRRPGRDRRRRQRLRDPRGREWLEPARGARAAAPQRPGAGRGADLPSSAAPPRSSTAAATS